MNRNTIQIDLFSYQAPVKKLSDGSLIDSRHIDRIDEKKRYRMSEAINILDVTWQTVYSLCSQLNLYDYHKEIDERHISDVKSERNYMSTEVAALFSCSKAHIYNLMNRGYFETTPVRKIKRIPGWSIIDFICENASNVPNSNQLDYLKCGNIILIPGWSLIDYIQNNCSRI